jgi:hypothetical protein
MESSVLQNEKWGDETGWAGKNHIRVFPKKSGYDVPC